ncbi:hypothetical protein DCS_00981 [Drechmeria coniospora]|uniref:SH3 domain-containing protein n=1 Tax=Drechmeria coniospora TaxID=98403 RepID=A0A151GRW3_DRECN|nr:hypothetical protein DCS_00981 [Drechmeria coniospora]KYK59847.1 hypothetical protein DCS_00981 [Drechmeria coniospora]
MVSVDRHTIMEANRSLRTIKTELENLLEKGVINDAVFEQIHGALPEESPLSGPLRTSTSATATTTAAPTVTAANSTLSPAPGPGTPVSSVNGEGGRQPSPMLGSNGGAGQPCPSPAPPSYEATPPPNPPLRDARPAIAHARALYRYSASDARDMAFEKDDRIAVHEYMNQDWWMGQNLRTGQQGIFPRNYVLVETEQKTVAGLPYRPPPQQMYAQGPPPPPQQQNPYNAHVPPMAVAEGSQQPPPPQEPQQGGGKAGELGKKFGKKLGNAAIFGAGATIGGNIVNSIF